MAHAPLNIAVIGLGRMGQLYAHTVATQGADARLHAVADPDRAARDHVAARYGVEYAFADPADALARPDIHAVVIATPTSTHRDVVVAAAGAGKAIFCEKPLALTLPGTRDAIAAAERAGVPLQVGFMRRFDAGYRKAKTLIDAGEIGQPVMFKAVGRDPFCPRPVFADPAHSGGLIIDMAIHDFDLARWLMGAEVERVTAEGSLLVCHELAAVGDIDNAVVNLRFGNGALGNVEVSRNAFYGYDIRTEVLGSEGAVVVGAYGHTPVTLLNRAGAHADVVPYLLERFGDAYRAQIAAFVACVREARPPEVGGADALAALAIGIGATEACRTGQPVML
jgi:scyllo-inositol 2-dehydrogenase (NAD+)